MRENSLLVLLIAATKACDIWYMREPVSTVQCNPFSGASMFDLRCVIQAPVSAGPRLDIVWFFTNTGGNTVQINMNTFPPLVSIASQNQAVMDGELIELTSTITLGRFSDPIHAGRYYCQAQVDGTTSSLTPSNALTFTADDAIFSSNPCGDSAGGMGLEEFTQATTRCAGSVSSSTVFVPLSTVSPTSTSQSDHSTSSPPTVLSSVLATSPTTDNIFSTDFTTTVSTQPLPGQLSLSWWGYVLVCVAAVFAMIILVLTLLFIALYLMKKITSFNQTSTQFDILTAANAAYGTSNSQTLSSIITSANSAYGTTEAAEIEEVANLENNDAYGIHTLDNEVEYAEITQI